METQQLSPMYLAAAMGKAWSPKEIPGLALWLRAEDLATLADGAAVAS